MTGELPRGWTATTLDQLVDGNAPIIYGILQPGPELATGVPYVRPTEIRDDVIQLKDVRRTSKEIAVRYARAALLEGDVLLSIVGTIGKVAIVPAALTGANITQSSVRIRPGTCLDSRFLKAVLKSPALTSQFEQYRLGTGVPRLNVAHVRELRCPLPPINEQRRIVAKLESLQARSRRAREALDAVAPLLEKLRQSVLAAAFRGDLTKDWRAKHKDVEPASELLKRIRAERRKNWEEAELAKMKAKSKAPTDDRWKTKYKDPDPVDQTEFPHLPTGWCWASLSEIASLQLGQRRAPEYAHDAKYPYVRAANITWRGLDLSNVKTMGFADPSSVRLERGDVVLSEASGSPSEVGKPALWNGEIPDCCFQATVLRVRSWSRSVLGQWLYLAFLRNASLGDFAAMAPGIGILHLTAERMRNWPIPLAPVPEQETVACRVAKALGRIYRVQDVAAAMLARQGEVDRALLAKAFRGELVPQDPNDEPADVMLARFRATMPVDGRARRSAAKDDPDDARP